MQFNLVLHGDIGTVNNFDQRAAKLAALIDININFLGPLLGAKESVVMKNLEFTEARNYMAKIADLGFKAEIRPTKKNDNEKAVDEKQSMPLEEPLSKQANSSLVLNQNRAQFKAPTDMPKNSRKPLKEREQPFGSSLGDLNEVNSTDELSLAEDQTEGDFSKFNWSKDLDDDDVVKYKDDLVIKKGR